jgi:hypothetical protein
MDQLLTPDLDPSRGRKNRPRLIRKNLAFPSSSVSAECVTVGWFSNHGSQSHFVPHPTEHRPLTDSSTTFPIPTIRPPADIAAGSINLLVFEIQFPWSQLTKLCTYEGLNTVDTYRIHIPSVHNPGRLYLNHGSGGRGYARRTHRRSLSFEKARRHIW